METIKTKECLNCPHLKVDETMEDYICSIEKNGLLEYVGETLWQISGSDKLRRCLKVIK
jgi:predicted ArsR family transcriptional regulator